MKHLALFILLLCASSAVLAQRTMGPYKVYVSKQKVGPSVIYSGSYNASASEGREIDIAAFDITGPITVDPTSYQLSGPPCPTYDTDGNRTPETPAPKTTATFAGAVNMEQNNVPTSGTTVQAEFKVKDNGYWTKCAENTQVPFDTTYLVKMNIHSLKLELATDTLNICNQDTASIVVTTRFPATGGAITWASSDNSVVSVTGSETRGSLTINKAGSAEITATLTAGNATYKSTCQVNANILKFKSDTTYNLWYAGGKIDALTLLTDESNKTGIEWAITRTSGAGTASVDANSGEISYPNVQGGTFSLGVRMKNDNTCLKTTRLVFPGFKAKVGATTVCDGDSVGVQIVLIPSSTPKSVLSQLGTPAFTSTTVDVSQGNPAGTTTHAFRPLDADYKSQLMISYWYSTQANHCNSFCSYRIGVSGTINGNAVTSATTKVLKVSAHVPKCLNGKAEISQYFSGQVRITTAKRGGLWYATVHQGTWQKNVQASVTILKAHPNSQYRTMISAEETYHVGQFMGTNASVSCNTYWLVSNIMTAVSAGTYRDVFEARAIAKARAAVIRARNAEMTRSNILFARTYCAREVEAKTAAGATHRATMPCMYPNCP